MSPRRLFHAMAAFCLAATALVFLCAAADAERASSLQAKRPDLFDPATGYRIARHRAPTPTDIPPPATRIDASNVEAVLAQGAVAIDVFGAAQSRFDDLDGTWLVSNPRRSLPGAIWLPETGRGVLEPVMQRYLAAELAASTDGDTARTLIIFCIADCWMSWNAAQRIAGMGYSDVRWFREGTDGWLDLGKTLVEVAPRPVDVD